MLGHLCLFLVLSLTLVNTFLCIFIPGNIKTQSRWRSRETEEVKRRADGVGSQFTVYLPVWNISPRQTFPNRVDCRFDKIMILLAPRWQDGDKRGVTLPFPCSPSHFQIVLFCVYQDVIFLAALRNAILEPKNPKFLHRNTRWMFGHIKFFFSRLCGCMYAFTYIYTHLDECLYLYLYLYLCL